MRLLIQPADVNHNLTNVDDFIKDYFYKSNTLIKHGVKKFIDWFNNYYQYE